MNLGLRDRVAIVTGATSGIGLSTAHAFLAEGASVAFCARDAGHVAETERRLRDEYGDRVLGAAADILDARAQEAFAAAVADRFGRVDALVHNAGASRMAGLADLDDAAWTDELELKFFGLLRPTRAFEPLLRISPGASIVYVSSLLAKQPETRLVATSAARAGALNLAKSMSIAYAPDGIRVNTILLGIVNSGQWERRYQARVAAGEVLDRETYARELARDREIPLGRVGEPRDVANAIVFLASPASSYITGATLEISGGLSRYV